MIGSLKRTSKPRDGTSQAHNGEGMTHTYYVVY